MRYLLFVAVISAALFFAGCARQYSEDPEIRQIQVWAEACGQMGSTVRTAILLNNAGALEESKAEVVDLVVKVYRPVCTGEPGPLNTVLVDASVKAAVEELCPGLSLEGDRFITVLEAATCAARRALLLQLESQQ